MEPTFRATFVTEMTTYLGTKTSNVTPTEIGVLRNRYKDIYDNTPQHLRPRIFEQLLCSVELYLTMTEELYKNNNPDFMKFVLKTSVELQSLMKQYLSAFELDAEK